MRGAGGSKGSTVVRGPTCQHVNSSLPGPPSCLGHTCGTAFLNPPDPTRLRSFPGVQGKDLSLQLIYTGIDFISYRVEACLCPSALIIIPQEVSYLVSWLIFLLALEGREGSTMIPIYKVKRLRSGEVKWQPRVTQSCFS